MPIAGAAEIAGSDDSRPHVQQHDPWLDQEALNRLAALFQENISPLVAIETLDDHPWISCPLHQPESLLCDITGIAHLFDGEAGLLQAAQEWLRSQKLTGRMAIADSVGAAWALAHFATETPSDGFIAPCETSASHVASLPIESLRISPATVGTLHRLGIEKNGQLFKLPSSGLATRLGEGLVRRIAQATGKVDEPLAVYRQPAENRYAMELEYPTDDQEILADRIRQLIEKARAGLAASGQGVLRLACRLNLAIHPPLTLEVGLFAPTLDVDHLTGLLANQIENQTLSAPAAGLTLTVTLTGPLRTSQTSLFENEPVERTRKTSGRPVSHQDAIGQTGSFVNWTSGSAVSRLVDSLSGRLGRDAVLGVALNDDPLPENAFTVWPLTGSQKVWQQGQSKRRTNKKSRSLSARVDAFDPKSSRRRYRLSPSPQDAMRRPLSLLVQPIPLVVESNRLFDASDHWLPEHFRLDGVTHRVIRFLGPERIETGWWKGPAIARDYYRIETDRGQWWWIFRQLCSKNRSAHSQQSRWMLHGRFS